MKVLYIFVVVLLVATATNGRSVVKRAAALQPSDHNRPVILDYVGQVRKNVNDFVDKLLIGARQYIVEYLDPLKLCDIHKGFNATHLGIVWHGELDLTKGWAQDLSTIYRSGDATADLENGTMIVTANLDFKDLTFNYDLSAKIMNIGPTGFVDGKANSVQTTFKLEVDPDSKNISVTEFIVNNVGNVTVTFDGMGTVMDWIVDELIKVVVGEFKDEIIDEIQDAVVKAVENALPNGTIGNFLVPPHHRPSHLFSNEDMWQ